MHCITEVIRRDAISDGEDRIALLPEMHGPEVSFIRPVWLSLAGPSPWCLNPSDESVTQCDVYYTTHACELYKQVTLIVH